MTRRRRAARRVAATVLALPLVAALAATVGVACTDPPLEALAALRVSPIVLARDGATLAVRTAGDGSRRVPVGLGAMGPWLPAATIAVEDERFRHHPGVDPLAIARALLQNLESGRRVSGASTITMQLCRMLDPRPRTLRTKLLESARAIRLERSLDKDAILGAYLDLAPYGGNLRGAEAAARWWFGRSARDLALHEAALLAGLPQSPERLRPDRHPDAARRRRDHVLDRLHACGAIDAAQRAAAQAEPVRLAAHPTLASDPGLAPHLATLALARRAGGGVTTLDPDLQRAVRDAVGRLGGADGVPLPADADVAAVVVDVETSSVVALVGAHDPADPRDGQVNGALAWRSPGSALKPFVYAAAFEAKLAAPDSALRDDALHYAGWSPRNIDRTHAGTIDAAAALAQSRNLPAIRLLDAVGMPRAVGTMEACGLRFRGDAAERAGLALAIGGAEVRPLDLAEAWATIARHGIHRSVRIFADESAPAARALSSRTCAALDAILSSHVRAPAGFDHLLPRERPWFAWKTGTSAGRRDAWAAGHNGRHAAAVWVGRFAGGGDPAFLGATVAEPLLAEILGRIAAPAPDDPLARTGDPAMPRWTAATDLAPATDADLEGAAAADLEGAAAAPCGPRIEQPAPDAVHVALDGRAVVPVRVTGDAATAWFLDGRPLSPAARLDLAPGTHELVVIDAHGRSAARRVVVIPDA